MHSIVLLVCISSILPAFKGGAPRPFVRLDHQRLDQRRGEEAPRAAPQERAGGVPRRDCDRRRGRKGGRQRHDECRYRVVWGVAEGDDEDDDDGDEASYASRGNRASHNSVELDAKVSKRRLHTLDALCHFRHANECLSFTPVVFLLSFDSMS